jgi:sodium-coupled neutral amino acid transporter 11
MRGICIVAVVALLNVVSVEAKAAGGSGLLQVGTGPAVLGGRRVAGKKEATTAAVHVVGAGSKKALKLGGDATVASSSFNLAKSIIGAGVLALPSGVAFFSDSPAALVPATIMLTVMGVAAGYTFSLIGKTCAEHNVSTFKQAWSKSVGPNSAWVISTAITFKCFFASLVNSIIIGDSFASLAQSFGLPDVLAQRTNVILTMTAAVLLPLCSMKSLNALSPFSLLGLGGVLYTALVMAVRFFDGSYAAKGAFFEAMAAAARPSFNKKGLPLLNVRAFVLLSMLSTSFIAHYNAPKFYAELKDTSLPRFNQVVKNAFGSSTLIYAGMMATGFLAFGGASGGFILNNYASNDALISFARFAIGLAIVTGTVPEPSSYCAPVRVP